MSEEEKSGQYSEVKFSMPPGVVITKSGEKLRVRAVEFWQRPSTGSFGASLRVQGDAHTKGGGFIPVNPVRATRLMEKSGLTVPEGIKDLLPPDPGEK